MSYLGSVADETSAAPRHRTCGLMQGDDLIWANVPMGGYTMQIGLSPNRKDIQPLNVGLIIVDHGCGDRVWHVAADRAAHCPAIGSRRATCRNVSRRRTIRAAAGERPQRTRHAGAQLQYDGARDRDAAVEPNDAAGRHFARFANTARADATRTGVAAERRRPAVRRTIRPQSSASWTD